MIEECKFLRDEQALSNEYLPEILPHRESQIDIIARNITPASMGRKPQNMFIYGAPGIGKTASIKYVFRKFQEFSDRVKTIYINTWNYNTAMGLLTKIILEMEYFVPRRGLSKDEVVEKLIEALKKTGKSIVVCLDEIDQLVKKDFTALYDLLRLNQYVNNPIGLVMISNYKDVFINIDARIRSSLDVEEIEFKKYSLQEMKDILDERIKIGFRPGCVEDGVVLLCANHAVERGGDVRVGLECLRKASKIAEQENSNKLKVEHVKKVLRSVTVPKLKIMHENIKNIDRNIIKLLKERDGSTSMELCGEYSKRFGKISQTAFRNHIKHLEVIGLIRIEKSRKKGRGRKYFIFLVKHKKFK